MMNYFYIIKSKHYEIKDCYIGRTINFNSRKSVHRSKINSNAPLYKFISSNGGWDSFDMFVFDMVSTDSLVKLQKLEKQYIIKYNANLNIQIPGRTIKQYYLDHHEKRKAQMIEYYNNHKVKCKECMRQNYLKRKKHKEMKIQSMMPLEIIED